MTHLTNGETPNIERNLSAPQAAEMLAATAEHMGGFASSLRELKIADALMNSPDALTFTESAGDNDTTKADLGKEIVGFYLDADANAKAIQEVIDRYAQSDRALFNSRAISSLRRYDDTVRFMATGDLMDHNLFVDYSDDDMNQRYLAFTRGLPADIVEDLLISVGEDERNKAAFWSLQITGFDDGKNLQKGLIDVESPELQNYIASTFGVKNG